MELGSPEPPSHSIAFAASVEIRVRNFDRFSVKQAKFESIFGKRTRSNPTRVRRRVRARVGEGGGRARTRAPLVPTLAVGERWAGARGSSVFDRAVSSSAVCVRALRHAVFVRAALPVPSIKLWCEMEPPGGRDSRFNLGYSMNLLSGETPPEIYGGGLGRPSTSLQLSPRHTMAHERGLQQQQNVGLDACGVNDINDDTYGALQAKKSPPGNGKKTKGRVKIKMEYIENKLRRYTTFSKRKTGIMKKAYELSTLTGTQVMLLVASETGHVYTFATRKLQPMITSEAGKALIQTCLNSPDPPAGSAGGDQRMSATGFEETELTYNTSDDDYKDLDDVQTTSDDEEMPDEEPEEAESAPDKREPSRTRAEAPEPIIDQIKQINDAIVEHNRSTAPVAPPRAPEAATEAQVNLKSVPLLVQTPNGLGFAAVSEDMILERKHVGRGE
ncbi:serum response factor homolog isoform X3 [Cylas formicarius]|uniref:serum response factor homolog isoform X3 n=1 Tax=Cylas formicarius TaxID=197179 RepID=UPI00295836A1|nr:serum response factor homolog isoform X3 [Cylas formicarius]